MASLPAGQRAEVRLKYPHMLREDVKVWVKHLGSDVLEWEEVWYDVHVGTAMPLLPGSPEWMKAVVDGVSRKRIDVVGRIGSQFYVIELKPTCTMSALGQVTVYRDLFGREFRELGRVRAMIICDLVEVDVSPSADRLGVRVLANEGVLL